MHVVRFFPPAAMGEQKDRFAVFLQDVKIDARVDPLCRAGQTLPSHPPGRRRLQDLEIRPPGLQPGLRYIPYLVLSRDASARERRCPSPSHERCSASETSFLRRHISLRISRTVDLPIESRALIKHFQIKYAILPPRPPCLTFFLVQNATRPLTSTPLGRYSSRGRACAIYLNERNVVLLKRLCKRYDLSF